jgi:hypothetical protein
MKDVLKSHKRRELKKQDNGWVQPATIRSALLVLRLIEVVARIINRLF